jgi:ubiquinone biosynthesis accessory factor UbiK
MANTPSFFQELQDKLKQLAEHSPAKDIEKNAKALAASVAGKLDLVPRVAALEAHSSKAV